MKNDINKTVKKVEALKKIFEGKSNLLIVIQNNPDPDSIAAALALRYIAHIMGDITCSIAHGGTVGRAENRALVKYLSVNLRHISEIDVSRYDVIGMVDTQPDAGNNGLGAGIIPDIVIDHHPCRSKSRSARFVDIRSNYGACSTILFEYLQCLNAQIDSQLATAIVYAIRSDTQDLGTEASKADITAIQSLYPLANLRMLSEIQRGRVERVYFKMLAKGVSNAYAYDKCIIANLGDIDNADMVAEVADLLLRDDNTTWSLCYAYCRGQMLLSIRSEEHDKKAGDVMHRIVSRKGTGGGHDTMAGGQITIENDTPDKRKKLEDLVSKRFLKGIGANEQTRVKLVN